MKNVDMTIPKALKFARHDFLNDLQIVLMQIDLGNVSKAKTAILKTTEKLRQDAMLESLRLPETEKWIQIFEWMFTSFHKTLVCEIKPGVREVDDHVLVAYLEDTFQDIEKILDPMSEYEACFDIKADENDWLVTITVTGALPEKKTATILKEKFIVEETSSHNLWAFTIRGQ